MFAGTYFSNTPCIERKWSLAMDAKKKYIIAAVILLLSIAVGVYYKTQNAKIDFFSVTEEPIKLERVQESAVTAEGEDTSFETETPKTEIKVYVTGEVNAPGVYSFTEGARVEDAVNAAGGFSDAANKNGINLAAYIQDAEQIIVPSINDEIDITLDKANDLVQNTTVNINTAAKEDLKTLPGIGDVLADRIIKHRNEQGLFKKIEDIQDVSGIGSGIFENIKDLITLGG